MAIESLVLFAVGLILLVKGADFFVDAAAKIAKIIGVSDLIIGLTIVAIGTPLPEITSSVLAALSGAPALAVGTVVGSNIANVALMLGIIAVFFGKIKLAKKGLERDVFIMLLITVLFFYFSIDGIISKTEGLIFVSLFIGYTLFLLGFMKRFEEIFSYDRFFNSFLGTEKFSLFNIKMYFQIMRAGIDPKTYQKLIRPAEDPFEEKLGKRIDSGEKTEAKKIFKKELISSFLNEVIVLIFGAVAIVFGARILVDGAIGLAEFIGVPESIIGLFLVGIGTSLPELGVSISSIRKGMTSILIGNIIGSNIANILLVTGTTSVIATLHFSFPEVFVPMFFMLSISTILGLFIWKNYAITRLAGFSFLLIYCLFIYFSAIVPLM